MGREGARTGEGQGGWGHTLALGEVGSAVGLGNVPRKGHFFFSVHLLCKATPLIWHDFVRNTSSIFVVASKREDVASTQKGERFLCMKQGDRSHKVFCDNC